MTKATELGFRLARPVGDNAPYDIVLDVDGHFVSVQVKSTLFEATNLKPGTFAASLFHINGPNHRYRPSDFDYVAIYCIPRDLWNIIPSVVAVRRQAIHVCPGDHLNQYEHYREAWPTL